MNRKTDFDSQLKHFLETSADYRNPANDREIAACDLSPETIHRIRSIVLRYGRAFAVRHRDYPILGAQNQCFNYAQNIAIRYGLGYVEGFALSKVGYLGASPCGIAYYHGWCIDKDSFVSDLQWMNNGVAYFGIEFSREYLTSRFNFFLKRYQETGQPMTAFLRADDFDETAANWKRMDWMPPEGPEHGCCRAW